MRQIYPLFSLLLLSLLSFSDGFSAHTPDSLSLPVELSSDNRNERNISKNSSKLNAISSESIFRQFEGLNNLPLNTVNAEIPFFIDQYVSPIENEELELMQKIESTYEKILEENRFIDFLEKGALLDLPVGIKSQAGPLNYIILIDSVVMTPHESFLYASMRFEVPQTGKKIYFKGSEIRFSKAGGLSGDGRLMLVGEYAMNLDGENSQLVIKGDDNQTYVEFDCGGYKSLSLDGSLVFSRNLLLPEDDQGNIIPEQNVAIDFTTQVFDWNDIIIGVSIPRFQIKGIKDMTFAVSNAVLDFSDSRNPNSVIFPQDYLENSPLVIGVNQNLWQGVYIRELSITLPPQFESDSTERISFRGNNLVIDHSGFSGRVSANNLISIEKGKIGNWDFSLETIYIDLYSNQLIQGGFAGRLNIPLNKVEDSSTDQDKIFTYEAVIRENNQYLFVVSNTEQLNFDLWKASVMLHPSSFIEVKVEEKKFLPRAHLNGEMTMNIGLHDGEASQDKSKNAKLARVMFQELEVQTIKPYVKVGAFSLGTEGNNSEMGGFPIRVNEIYGAQSGDDVILGVDLTLALINEEDGGFAADGRFNLYAESVENHRDLTYRFKKIELERFGIDIDKGAFKFKGNINFYKEDPIYGNGISGTVDAEFQPNLKVQASAIFGTKNGRRYWFVDAMAQFNSGVTVFPGVAFYAFGGGAYYHMKIDSEGVGSPLGQTASGIVYVPDVNVGFGFKASVGLGVQPGKKAFYADATFEMAFNQGGGLKYINFRGNGYFLMEPQIPGAGELRDRAVKIAEATQASGNGEINQNAVTSNEIYGRPGDTNGAQIWASVIINYDFDNSILHANMRAFIDVAGGVIRGGGANNLAGEAVLHFAPTEWYIYIGRPEYENRFAIEIMGIARMDSYFVMGTTIPDTPAPPANVSSILGGMDLDYMKDLNALSEGAGVGFGSSFSVDTGDITFLMFYGRFAAGIGFDIMLKDYGDIHCRGTGQLGVDGWYANGQAYAYFEGRIGIRVKVFGKRKRVDILNIGAAVVAQAKLPNPTWVKGIAGGRFSVLGGLVKGTCRFEIEIGEECEIIQDGGSPLESIEVLAQLTPQDQSKDVDVFTVPQAVFNFEMDKAYEMVDINDQVIKFKISLDEFVIKQDGGEIRSDLEWNDDGTVAALKPFEILPAQKDILVEVTTSFKEFKSGNWVIATVDGERLTEKHTIKFKTGLAPDYIPEHNIAYSYPSINQFNYYKAESMDGYITLKQGQDYLFQNKADWDHVVRISSSGGDLMEVEMTYVTNSKEIRFSMPGSLNNDQIYSLGVLNVPTSKLMSIDTNVSSSTKEVDLNNSGSKLSIETKIAEGSLKENKEKVLFKSNFRTSRYNTFTEKVMSVSPSSGWRDPIFTGVHAIGSNIGGPEPFSYEEIYGSDRNAPFVQMEADLNKVDWYNKEVYPIVYDDYPINGIIKISEYNRDPDLYGTVPTKAVFLYQYPYRFELTDKDITRGLTLTTAIGRIDYYLAYYMYYDYLDLATQAANIVGRGGAHTGRLNRLLSNQFPVIQKGDYWVDVNYVLPGKNTVTSTYRHKIFNPID